MNKKLYTLLVLISFFTIQVVGQTAGETEDNERKVNPRFAGKEKVKVYELEIFEEIFPPAQRKLDRALDEADSMNADVILMKLDTYGGAVDVADHMRTRLLNTKALTIVYIINNAASAGALLSVACDSIYMAPEATIGAAVVVEGGSGDAASEKYQSYFRQKFRATAEKKNRDPDIAEAMVNPDIYIPGVIDSGKILTLTSKEAVLVDYCDGIVNSTEEALNMAGIYDYEITRYEATFVDKVLSIFTHPAVSGILITVIFFGIFFELQTPGVGFPLGAAVLAAILYFTPLYLDGLAENWEILLFVVGLALLALELFVIPGFGIAGVAGIALVVGSLTLSLIGNVRFDFNFVDIDEIAGALGIVIGSIIVTITGVVLLGSRFHSNALTKALIFTDTQDSEQGYQVDSFRGMELLHRTGVAITSLRPSGKVEIDNERYDAYSAGEWIEKGDEIIVLRAKGASLVVRKSS